MAGALRAPVPPGTHVVDGIAVCDRCGQPRQVRFADVRPEGFEGPNPFGGELLPCSCDCSEESVARRAAAAMLRHDQQPVVAYNGCGSPEGASRVAAAWQRATPSNFVAWVDGVEARMTGMGVYKAVCSGDMRMTHELPVGVADCRDFSRLAAEERARYALLVHIDALDRW